MKEPIIAVIILPLQLVNFFLMLELERKLQER